MQLYVSDLKTDFQIVGDEVTLDCLVRPWERIKKVEFVRYLWINFGDNVSLAEIWDHCL